MTSSNKVKGFGRNKVKGFAAGVVAAVCYGTNPLGTLVLYGDGFNSSSVLIYRYLLAVVSLGCDLADKAKLVFKVNTGAAVLGLGYIIGLKYAFYTCLGSFVVWWLIVPGMSVIFHDSVLSAWDPSIVKTVGAMSPEEIFRAYARSIGIGGIAMAGIIGIIKSWGIIKSAVGLAALTRVPRNFHPSCFLGVVPSQ